MIRTLIIRALVIRALVIRALMIKIQALVFIAFFLTACYSNSGQEQVAANKNAVKFSPVDDRILVLVGQSVKASRDYYLSPIVPRPAGFTDYISYDVGSQYREFAPDYPRYYQGNDALLEPTNWGSGVQCVDCNLHHPEFSEAVVAIGMYMAGPRHSDGSMCHATEECNTYKIANGLYDEQLQVLADWLNSLKGRPVFLRIGYEFDGSWNHYDAEQYKQAYKYIYHYLKKAGVDNVAYVWQTYGYASMETLENFYPQPDDLSDRYVDWIGYSYFHINSETPGVNEIKFARENNIKAFLSEVAPHTGDCTKQINMAKDTELGKKWIDNFFLHVEKNKDVIAGLSYINEVWNDVDNAPQWQDQQDHNCGGYFSKSNSRLQDNIVLEKYWAEKISSSLFLNWQENLYEKLVP